MKTLHLNLIKIWFDKILSKEKKEEYREVKPFWCSRFLIYEGKHRSVKWWTLFFHHESDPTEAIIELIKFGDIDFKEFNTITFSNGMKPIEILPRFEIELKGIEIDFGVSEWGAKDHTKYFVIKLGTVIDKTKK